LDIITLLFHIVTLSLLLFLLFVLIGNLFYLRKNTLMGEAQGPFLPLSVLIPARNEEKKIKKCLKSILAQDYPNFEVLVYNDHSEDRTREYLEEFSRKFPNLTVLDSLPLPPGWMGKNFACYELSKNAKGDLLLFVDADTALEPGALRKAVHLMREKRADLLSFIPSLEMATISEKMMLPLIPMAFMTFLPLRLVEGSKNPDFSAALGPFILIKKSTYKRIGGHAEIASEIVDDLSLAKLVKSKGGKIALLSGKDILKVRFYEGFKEIWNGLTKSAFGAFDYSLLRLAFFLTFAYGLFLYPVIALFEAIFLGTTRPDVWLLTAEVAIIYGFRAIPDLYFGYEAKWLPLFPISMFIGFLVALNSARWALFKKGVVWKDRFYYIPKPGDRV